MGTVVLEEMTPSLAARAARRCRGRVVRLVIAHGHPCGADVTVLGRLLAVDATDVRVGVEDTEVFLPLRSIRSLTVEPRRVSAA